MSEDQKMTTIAFHVWQTWEQMRPMVEAVMKSNGASDEFVREFGDTIFAFGVNLFESEALKPALIEGGLITMKRVLASMNDETFQLWMMLKPGFVLAGGWTPATEALTTSEELRRSTRHAGAGENEPN